MSLFIFICRNESEVGRGVVMSGVPRSGIFITSKISTAEHGEEEAYTAIKVSIANIGCNYLDMMLIHWPGWCTFQILALGALIKKTSVY